MKIITKNRDTKTLFEAKNDIVYSFDYLIAKNNLKTQNQTLYKIDLTNTKSKHIKHLNFDLKNKFFVKLERENPTEILDYLFVIEYDGIISIGNQQIDEVDFCKVHSHIVVNTTLPIDLLINQFIAIFPVTTFEIDYRKNNCDVYIENISKRIDKENYINYLIKQDYLNEYAYNYKIKY